MSVRYNLILPLAWDEESANTKQSSSFLAAAPSHIVDHQHTTSDTSSNNNNRSSDGNSTTTTQQRPWLMKILRGVAISATVAIILVLTYHQCIWCVLVITLFSALTMSCIPLMPLVFLMSLFVLMFHAIDYQRASIRVEVPLQDIVYVPSWDDFAKYVKVAPLQPP